jgi:hypothetical protein
LGAYKLIAVMLSLLLSIGIGTSTTLKYCIDNSTLYTMDNIIKVKNGIETQYNFNETIECQYGCFNSTIIGANCNQSSYVNNIILIVIFIVIIFLFLWFWNTIKGLW